MNYQKLYQHKVSASKAELEIPEDDTLTLSDIRHLPKIVQKYLVYTGSVGKPKVKYANIKASGKIRSKPTDNWMEFRSEQYNFYPQTSRYFYIKAKKAGVAATGLHRYESRQATMEIKLAGLLKIVDARGDEMNISETVTFLNDMCFMAPAALIDKNITWVELDSLNVKARYTNENLKVEAKLTFDSEGRLIDFISYQRFETVDGKTYKNYPWRTPVRAYANFNGYILPSRADVIYVKPEGEFCYGIFELNEINYN